MQWQVAVMVLRGAAMCWVGGAGTLPPPPLLATAAVVAAAAAVTASDDQRLCQIKHTNN